MQNISDPQCHTVQMQMDSYLDGDMPHQQESALLSHCNACQDCHEELRIARVIHNGLEALPLLDCPDALLTPLRHLSESSSPQKFHHDRPSFLFALTQLFHSTPAFVRYSMPAILVLVVTLTVVGFNSSQQFIPQIAEEQYTVEEMRKALDDFNLAIDYLNNVSQRTEVMIGDRFLITPLQDSLNASFDSIQERRARPGNDDPI